MESTNLMDLPVDILINIFMRLLAMSECSIRCVSKTVLDMIDGPAYRRLLGDAKIEAEAPPELVLFAQDYIEQGRKALPAMETLEYDDSNNHLTTRGKHEGRTWYSSYSHQRCEYQINFVFGNLVCLKHLSDYRRYFLVNPLTTESLMLPTLGLQEIIEQGRASRVVFEKYGMGFDDITNSYKIVCVSRHKHSVDDPFINLEGSFVTRVLVLGTRTWREVPSVPPYNCDLDDAVQNVCAYGDMHWLLSHLITAGRQVTRPILSFNFKKEEFCITQHPISQERRSSLDLHLLTMRGAIAIADTCSSNGTNINIQIWVMKDYDRKGWRLDYTINMEMLEGPRFETWYYTCG